MRNKIKKQYLQSIKKPWLLNNNQQNITYKINEKFTAICCKYLPKSVRRIVFLFSYKTSNSFSRFINLLIQLSFRSFFIQGKDNQNQKITILGLNNEDKFPYLSNILLSSNPTIKENEKINIFKIKKKLNQIKNIDAIIIKTDIFYSGYFEKKGFIIIPEFVTLNLETIESLENILSHFSKSAKEDIRKIKKQNYTYEITDDPKKLDMFYYKMYLPYIKWKHGKNAVCSNYFVIRQLFESNNKLMLIKYKNEYVYGALFRVKNKKVIATYVGAIKEKNMLFKKGLGSASYYFLLLWAKENNIEKIDFGQTRAFLNDGVTRFKRKWGTAFEKIKTPIPNIYAIGTSTKSNLIQNLKNNDPFVYIEKNKIKTTINNEKSKAK